MEITARRPGIPATTNVLALLCAMYFINYIVRVNVSTAAAVFGPELHLTNTQIGLIFSAFAYPYLAFQVAGGWVADKFGARRALTVFAIVWSSATVLMGLANSLSGMILGRVLLGIGVSALPVATRAMSNWMPAEKRGFAQGITHAFARLGNALTPPLVAWLILLVSWRGSFVVIGTISFLWAIAVGDLFPRRPGGASGHHAVRPGTPPEETREDRCSRPVCAPGGADVSGHAGLFLLRLDALVLPRLDSSVFPSQLQPEVEQLGALRVGRLPRRHVRRFPGRGRQRSHLRADAQPDEGAAEHHHLRLPGVDGIHGARADGARPDDHRAVVEPGVLLRGVHRGGVLGDPDGHRAALLGICQRLHELGLRARGDCLSAHRRDASSIGQETGR